MRQGEFTLPRYGALESPLAGRRLPTQTLEMENLPIRMASCSAVGAPAETVVRPPVRTRPTERR